MNGTIQLPPDQVHVWVVEEDDVRDPDLLQQYLRLLSDEEISRKGRFHFQADRHRFLLTRALVRTVLSRYCRVAPEAWQFVEDAHGRPDVLNGVAAASGITFNISHSTGAIACAVTRATTIGIDLESIARQPLPLDVAMAHFSVAEVESLNTATVSAQAPLFFAYWTLKEAYLKAIGKGLSVPLNQLRFDLREQRHIHVSFDIPLADDSERWQFLLFRIFAEHLLAICVPRDAMTKNTVIVRKAIPLSTDQIVDVELLRQSPALPVVSLQL